jgi:predicted TIM-barrel fold metal-dependent hydrolase
VGGRRRTQLPVVDAHPRRARLQGHGELRQDDRDTFYFGVVVRDEIQRTLSELIIAGVFERHPNLHVVAAEAGIDYVARLEKRLDSTMQMWWHALDHELKLMPSEYFRRNVYCTVHLRSDRPQQPSFHRRRALHVVERLSPRRGTWPNSAATVKAEFDEFGVPEEQRCG